jgi:hypothetical protein
MVLDPDAHRGAWKRAGRPDGQRSNGLETERGGRDTGAMVRGRPSGHSVGSGALVQGQADTWWKGEWENGKSGATLRRLLPTLDKKTINLYDGLTRAETAVLVQLRTGKIGPNAYLAKIGVVDSETCHCGLGAQTHLNRQPKIRQPAPYSMERGAYTGQPEGFPGEP